MEKTWFAWTALAWVLAASVVPGLARSEAVAGTPNIVLVIADDLGIDALSCYGSETYRTPNVDRLAKEGLRFTHAYATPVCGPSRAMIMTGQYPFRNGAIDIDNTMSVAQPPRVPSLPAMLKARGYATGVAGKFRQMKGDVADWGFGESIVSPTGGGYYWEKTWTENGKPVSKAEPVYFPAELQRFALSFVERHKDGPFFLYYPMINPHVPIERTPDSAPGETDPQRLYADNITWIDRCVGELLAKLDAHGLAENTLVLFTGDNGTLRNFAGRIGGRVPSGGKAQMNEGGTHVPLLARWPKAITPGRVSDALVDFTDFLPTFVELAGTSLPAGHVIDGRSFGWALRGEKGEGRTWVFSQLGHDYFVRGRDYRLDQSGTLWDLRGAPFSETKVAMESETGAARAARSELQAVLDGFDPKSGSTWAKWTGFGGRGPGNKKAGTGAQAE